MSKRYTPEEKADAMRVLDQRRYDVISTSLITGIPQRTLYKWRRELQLERRFVAAESISSAAAAAATVAAEQDESLEGVDEEDDDPGSILMHIHRKMLDDIVKLSANIEVELATMSPYQRIRALALLIDRLDKIDRLIPQNAREMIIRFEYEDPLDDPNYRPPDFHTDEEIEMEQPIGFD